MWEAVNTAPPRPPQHCGWEAATGHRKYISTTSQHLSAGFLLKVVTGQSGQQQAGHQLQLGMGGIGGAARHLLGWRWLDWKVALPSPRPIGQNQNICSPSSALNNRLVQVLSVLLLTRRPKMVEYTLPKAQKAQGTESFDLFNTFSSKQKLQQTLIPGQTSAWFWLAKGEIYIEQLWQIQVST